MLDRFALASFASHTDRKLVRSAPPTWPLPGYAGRDPVVIDTIDHGVGIDLAFERAHEGELVDKYPPGSRNGTVRHFMPNLWPVLAVSDGAVAYAGRQTYGHSVLIDHRNGWATFYSNLAHLLITLTPDFRRRRSRVQGGQIIGFVGAPRTGAMKCLRFELWRIDVDGFVERVNPRRFLYRWEVSHWDDTYTKEKQPEPAPSPSSGAQPSTDGTVSTVEATA